MIQANTVECTRDWLQFDGEWIRSAYIVQLTINSYPYIRDAHRNSNAFYNNLWINECKLCMVKHPKLLEFSIKLKICVRILIDIFHSIVRDGRGDYAKNIGLMKSVRQKAHTHTCVHIRFRTLRTQVLHYEWKCIAPNRILLLFTVWLLALWPNHHTLVNHLSFGRRKARCSCTSSKTTGTRTNTRT